VRWFQYGSFCPFSGCMERAPRPAELSAWGPEAIDILVDAKERVPQPHELWFTAGGTKILTAFDAALSADAIIYSSLEDHERGYTPMRPGHGFPHGARV